MSSLYVSYMTWIAGDLAWVSAFLENSVPDASERFAHTTSMEYANACVFPTSWVSSNACTFSQKKSLYHTCDNIACTGRGSDSSQRHRYSGRYANVSMIYHEKVYVSCFAWCIKYQVFNPEWVGRKPTRNLAITLIMSANLVLTLYYIPRRFSS